MQHCLLGSWRARPHTCRTRPCSWQSLGARRAALRFCCTPAPVLAPVSAPASARVLCQHAYRRGTYSSRRAAPPRRAVCGLLRSPPHCQIPKPPNPDKSESCVVNDFVYLSWSGSIGVITMSQGVPMDAKKTTESSPLAVHLSVWHPVADRNVNSYDCYTIHLYTDIKVSLGLRSTTDAHVEFHMQNVGSTTLRLSVTFKNSHWGDWQPMTKTFTLEPEKYLPGEDGGLRYVCIPSSVIRTIITVNCPASSFSRIKIHMRNIY